MLFAPGSVRFAIDTTTQITSPIPPESDPRRAASLESSSLLGPSGWEAGAESDVRAFRRLPRAESCLLECSSLLGPSGSPLTPRPLGLPFTLLGLQNPPPKPSIRRLGTYFRQFCFTPRSRPLEKSEFRKVFAAHDDDDHHHVSLSQTNQQPTPLFPTAILTFLSGTNPIDTLPRSDISLLTSLSRAEPWLRCSSEASSSIPFLGRTSLSSPAFPEQNRG
ncbi:hypothetical protein H6P81_010115 [Aristolochia fimbriata]|uniref:Uncharacterized protein n=1 Tax=Aristolochia fimbriata TaxID=158543 RepID=A0AAV7EMV4_ARIFI|nr:hypothetical protein H6P81_010115 [Aristolochia fimbriata]